MGRHIKSVSNGQTDSASEAGYRQIQRHSQSAVVGHNVHNDNGILTHYDFDCCGWGCVYSI